MNKKSKSKGKRAIGKSLNAKFDYKKLKKISKKQGSNIFICESHAHCPDACGARFNSFSGSVTCPNCGNQYCRWENYKEPEKPLSNSSKEASVVRS